VGIGRFAYTPVLPEMQAAAGFGAAAAGWIAGWNYLGYLLGALGASLIAGRRLRVEVLMSSVVASVVTTGAMGFTQKYMTLAAAATTTGKTMWLVPDCISAWSFQVKTGTITAGTFTVEASNDPRARQTSGNTASAEWTDITADTVGISNPSSSAVEFVVTLDPAVYGANPFAFVRLVYTDGGSGGGVIDAWFSGQS